MKLGNVSQTIVPVPNFFFNRKHHPIETFNTYNKTEPNIKTTFNFTKKHLTSKQKIKTQLAMETNLSLKTEINDNNKSNKTRKINFKRRNSNFSDRNILTTFYDININNNPRFHERYWLNSNKEKYIPNYYKNNLPNMTQINETFFPEIIDTNKIKNLSVNKKNKNSKNDMFKMMSNFYNYKKYKNNTLIKKLSPDLRQELQSDTRNLIDKINMNYDLSAWNKFDSRTTMNRFFQTGYSPISDVVKNTESIRDKFIETINKKAMGLKTINNQVQKNNIKYFNNINYDVNNIREKKEEKSVDELLEKNKSNLIKLKYNNITKLQYNDNDKKFIKENEYITKKINKTKLYKEFPSKTRAEFNTKKIITYKQLFKVNKPIKNMIPKDKYGDDVYEIEKKTEIYNMGKMWKRPLHDDAYKIYN